MRQALVDKFQLNANVRMAVLSVKAAGVGLTLTEASLVIFGELVWTPGDIIQASARYRCRDANVSFERSSNKHFFFFYILSGCPFE